MARPRMDWTGPMLFVALAYGSSWGWLFLVPQLPIPLWTPQRAADQKQGHEVRVSPPTTSHPVTL